MYLGKLNPIKKKQKAGQSGQNKYLIYFQLVILAPHLFWLMNVKIRHFFCQKLTQFDEYDAVVELSGKACLTM
jgi:hypothetical protein